MKAVIPAAGFGTRFLPYTKAQAKEMLPVLDKPAIQHVVEEALASGLLDIFIVTGRTKRAIEDHFDANPELERHLRERGHDDLIRTLDVGSGRAHFAYIRQPRPAGNGHAVLCAETAVGNEAFAVLLGDDVLVGNPPCTLGLIESSSKLGASCIAVQRVPRDRVSAYGMVTGEEIEDGLFRIKDVIEKPKPSEVTSELVTIGRYVLSPSIFRHLRRAGKGRDNEIWLTDGIRSMLRAEDVYARVFHGRRFDIGSKVSWLLANLELAADHPEYREEVRKFSQELLKRKTSRT